MTTTTDMEPDVMTWFPKKSDYEQEIVIQPDETFAEKVERLHASIEMAQHSIKEVVDEDHVGLEEKIYRSMDSQQDLAELAELLKECESSPEASKAPEDIKKAKVGLINLKAYLSQADVVQFATAILNENLFKVGSAEGFAPWLAAAEAQINCKENKPASYDEAMKFEEASCLFLKEVVKGNKMLKRIKESAEALKTNIGIQEELSKLSERYYVLCKKADSRVKNIQSLLREWKRLDDILAPKDPSQMDDLQVKQFVHFLHTYRAIYV